MRRPLLLSSLLLAGGMWIALAAHAPAQAQRDAASSASGGTAASSRVGGGGAQASSSTGRENCGTPDEFRPCPPMPRVPLREYPGNR